MSSDTNRHRRSLADNRKNILLQVVHIQKKLRIVRRFSGLSSEKSRSTTLAGNRYKIERRKEQDEMSREIAVSTSWDGRQTTQSGDLKVAECVKEK